MRRKKPEPIVDLYSYTGLFAAGLAAGAWLLYSRSKPKVPEKRPNPTPTIAPTPKISAIKPAADPLYELPGTRALFQRITAERHDGREQRARDLCIRVAAADNYKLLEATEKNPLEWLERDSEATVHQYYVPMIGDQTDNILWNKLLFNPSCDCPSRDGSWLRSLILYAPGKQFDAIFCGSEDSKAFVKAFIAYQIQLVCKKQHKPDLEKDVVAKLQKLVHESGMKELREYALLAHRREKEYTRVRAISQAILLSVGTRLGGPKVLANSYAAGLAVGATALVPLRQIFYEGVRPQLYDITPLLVSGAAMLCAQHMEGLNNTILIMNTLHAMVSLMTRTWVSARGRLLADIVPQLFMFFVLAVLRLFA